MSKPGALDSALLASGFPFQTAVEAIIAKAPRWEVMAREYPWVHPDGTQFLDIVAQADRITVGIECKKTTKENYVFLLPGGSTPKETGAARLLAAEQIRDSNPRWELYVEQWHIAPTSHESAFCVVANIDAKGGTQRLVERDAGLLLLGTDAYARRTVRDIPTDSRDKPRRPFLPLLVTNAPLFVAPYPEGDVSLESGEFTNLPPKRPSNGCASPRASRPMAGATWAIELCLSCRQRISSLS